MTKYVISLPKIQHHPFTVITRLTRLNFCEFCSTTVNSGNLPILRSMNAKGGYVYIMASKNRNTIYIGVTSDLYSRAYQHKNGEGSIFSKRYNCIDLIYFEFFEDIESAIRREKRIKKYSRKWKDNLIKEFNPTLRDLFDEVSEMR